MSAMTPNSRSEPVSREASFPGVPLSLVSFCLDRDTKGQLKTITDSFPSIRLRKHWDNYYPTDDSHPISELMGDPPVDICLMDFDEDPGSAAIATERLSVLIPGTAVFAVSSQEQADLIIRAMRSGCSEYLIKPLAREQFLNAVSRVALRKRDKKDLHNAQVMSFIGAKGGCGVTTLVTQLGALLASSYIKKTMVVDLHPNLGDVALYLGVTKYRYHSFELIENTDRLDSELLQSLVVHHPSGLDLVPAPNEIDPSRRVLPGTVAPTFNFLKLHYDFILGDLPPGLNEANLEFITNSDQIYIVTVAEVSALRNVAKQVDYLTRNDVPPERIRVVLNRYDKRSLITDTQIEKVIGQNLFWKVPNQYFQVSKTINAGDPIAQLASSDVMRNLQGWAEAVGVKPSAEAKKKESRGILGRWGA